MLGVILCAAAALLYAAIHYAAERFVYQPCRFPKGWWHTQAELRARDVWLETGDGLRIHAWRIDVPDAPVMTLYLHGNGDNISVRPGHLREIAAAGSSVLILDYRGYGKSPGRPTERGLYRDAEAGYDYLIGAGFRAERIVLHGESLGSSVAVDLAARRPCAGIILECPITSAGDMARQVVPVMGALFVWGYNARRKIAGVRAPILIIHGDDDRMVPYAMGRALFDAANEPKSFWTVHGARHLNIVAVAGPRYGARLREFYESLGLRDPRTALT